MNYLTILKVIPGNTEYTSEFAYVKADEIILVEKGEVVMRDGPNSDDESETAIITLKCGKRVWIFGESDMIFSALEHTTPDSVVYTDCYPADVNNW